MAGFSVYARENDVGSVHALPLRLRSDAIGAMNLFCTASGPFPEMDLRLGQALADMATIGILHERAVRRGRSLPSSYRPH